MIYITKNKIKMNYFFSKKKIILLKNNYFYISEFQVFESITQMNSCTHKNCKLLVYLVTVIKILFMCFDPIKTYSF